MSLEGPRLGWMVQTHHYRNALRAQADSRIADFGSLSECLVQVVNGQLSASLQ